MSQGSGISSGNSNFRKFSSGLPPPPISQVFTQADTQAAAPIFNNWTPMFTDTGTPQYIPTSADFDVPESGIGAGITSLHSTVTYSAKAIESLVPKLKKNDLESYIVWKRKFTVNLVFNNLSHVIDANYMSQALPPTQAEVMHLPRNHCLSVLVCKNDQVMTFFNKAILDDD